MDFETWAERFEARLEREYQQYRKTTFNPVPYDNWLFKKFDSRSEAA